MFVWEWILKLDSSYVIPIHIDCILILHDNALFSVHKIICLFFCGKRIENAYFNNNNNNINNNNNNNDDDDDRVSFISSRRK